MDIIAFDLSRHTGYSVFRDAKLINYGLLEEEITGFKAEIKKYTDLPDSYPFNLISAADTMVDRCWEIYNQYPEAKVVVEHTEKGKQRISQKFLLFLHYAFSKKFEEVGFKYLLVSDWRIQTKCYLKHWPEYKRWNGRVGRAKRKAKPTKAGSIVAKIDGKVVSTINQKKLSIILANEKYGLSIKDDNIADAINIGRAAVELKLFD